MMIEEYLENILRISLKYLVNIILTWPGGPEEDDML